jgi:hypothetical protein
MISKGMRCMAVPAIYSRASKLGFTLGLGCDDWKNSYRKGAVIRKRGCDDW